MQFSKWHALGNSYLVVEQPDAGPLTPARVQRLCSVETGIGSDGVLEVVDATTRRSRGHDLEPRRLDGRDVGQRRPDRSALARGRDRRERGHVDDGGRTRSSARMLERARHGHGRGRGRRSASRSSSTAIELTTASVGNPHAVVRLDDPTRDDLLRLGPLLETHERFPERTNVQLVRVDGRHDLTVLVWERGAGETSASGLVVRGRRRRRGRARLVRQPRHRAPPGRRPSRPRWTGGQAWLTGPAERSPGGRRRL